MQHGANGKKEEHGLNGEIKKTVFAKLISSDGKELELIVGSNLIGRKILGTQDKRISRKHAEIIISSQGSVQICGLSSNSTYVRRLHSGRLEKVSENSQRIENGDTVVLLEESPEFEYRLVMNEVLPPDSMTQEESDKTQPIDLMDINQNSKNQGSPLRSFGVSRTLSKSPPKKQNSFVTKMNSLGFGEMKETEFEIMERVGVGTCGEVLKANFHGTIVAIKKIFRTRIQKNKLTEFSSEVEILRKLRHPNIVLFMVCALTQN